MEEITLQPYTWERCLDFWRDYVADPAMMDGEFSFDEGWVRQYFHGKVQQPNRRVYAVCLGEQTIGEVTLKHLDWAEKSATLSIHFANDRYKDRGFGTQAEQMILREAFEALGLETVCADCVLRNTRSQHVLEKVGFRFLREDAGKRYYRIKKEDWHGNPGTKAHRLDGE